MNEVRKHIQLGLESWLILQELKARLRCRSYSEVFRILEKLVLEPLRKSQDIRVIQNALREVQVQETSRFEQERVSKASSYPEPSENKLPSYLRNNPWLDILARRGRDVQA
ncbi:MAG: hypothetical protein DRN15_08810 [Thermoprotei archaeon]|nr:MAG: hypothetical protein DRN15_08810 [Thermoprotei archaeon]